MTIAIRYTVEQDGKYWVLRGPDREIYPGESYLTEAAAKASADRKNTKKVLH